MAATFAFDRDHGTLTSGRGATTSTGVSDVNWKNTDVEATAYSASPITFGNNSFENWLFGHFSGSYNQISAGLWAHTLTAFGTGETLKGTVTSTYTTPATTTNAALSTDMTTAIAIASGQAVLFTPTSPNTGSPTSSTTANPAYTQFLPTQLQTTTSAPAGDTPQVTLTLQYNEN